MLLVARLPWSQGGRVRMGLLKQLQMRPAKLSIAALLLLGILSPASPMLSTGGSRRAAFAQSFAPDIPIEEAIRIARSAVPNAVIKK